MFLPVAQLFVIGIEGILQRGVELDLQLQWIAKEMIANFNVACAYIL